MNPLPDAVVLVLAEARRYLQVREQPRDSNRSIEIDYWLHEVGVPLALPWCAAFVWNMGRQALGTHAWPVPRTASCQALHDWAESKGILKLSPEPGDLFLLWESTLTPQRFGHTGLVTDVATPGRYASIEGNTNPGGSRDGYGVFARSRPIDETTRYVRWAQLAAA